MLYRFLDQDGLFGTMYVTELDVLFECYGKWWSENLKGGKKPLERNKRRWG
jgi:hypothetical protein